MGLEYRQRGAREINRIGKKKDYKKKRNKK